jgi:2-phospho-L-lactate guanylyltransferase
MRNRTSSRFPDARPARFPILPLREAAGAAVVVPVRAFLGGKSRLSNLRPEERARLLRASAEAVVRAAAGMPVAIVSADPDVRSWASSLGLVVLDDPGTLDGASTNGARWAAELGIARVVLAHADLPLARSLSGLTTDADRPVVAAVPCHRDDGTPVLSVPTSVAFRFSYGPGSFRRHAAEARRLALGFRVVRDPDLAHDVDLPEDLAGVRPLRVRRLSEAWSPTDYGEFRCFAFEGADTHHLALVAGDVTGHESVLVRVHSECLTGDVFASRRCDCGSQLHESLRRIATEGRGVVVYLRGHEGRGIGIGPKLMAYRLQELGWDTVDANLKLGFPVDSREFGTAAAILDDLGVRSIRLLSNSPAKCAGVAAGGTPVVERLSLNPSPTLENLAYLRAKKDRLGHLFDDLGPVQAGSTHEVAPC